MSGAWATYEEVARSEVCSSNEGGVTLRPQVTKLSSAESRYGWGQNVDHFIPCEYRS